MFFRKFFVGVLLVFGLATYSQATVAQGIFTMPIKSSSYIGGEDTNTDFNLAYLLSKVSSFAYSDTLNEIDKVFLNDNGFYSFKHFVFYNTAGWKFDKTIKINGQDKKVVIIGFRGTRTDTPANQFLDIMADLNAYSVPFYDNDKVRVHNGFHTYFKNFRNNESGIVNIKDTDAIYILTGHSLGGAIAKLYGASLRERGVASSNVLIYTFGAPPISWNDGGFDNRYNIHSGNLPLKIIESSNKLDPIFHLQFKYLGKKTGFLNRTGQNLIPFKENGEFGQNYPGCNLAGIVGLGSIGTATIQRYDGKLPDCNIDAHSKYLYTYNISKNLELTTILENNILDANPPTDIDLTFNEYQLSTIKVLLSEYPYKNGVSGEKYLSSKLDKLERRKLLDRLKKIGVFTNYAKFGELGANFKLLVKDIVDSKQDILQSAKNVIDSSVNFDVNDYQKLAVGTVLNTASAVGDVLTFGGATAGKVVLKLPKIITATGKLGNAVNVLIKTGKIVSSSMPYISKAIDDKDVSDSITELKISLLELVPWAGPIYAQYNLSKKISDDIDNKPEVKAAWANFFRLNELMISDLERIGNATFIKRIDVVLSKALEELKKNYIKQQELNDNQPTLQITLPQNATIDGYKLNATQGDTVSFQGGITAGFLRGCIHDAGDSATYTLWYIDIDGKRKSLALNFDSFNQTFSFAMPSSQITMVDLAYDNNIDDEFEHQSGFCGLPLVWESVVDANGTVESNETVNLSNGLVAHYEFEGDANDSSGNGNHGTEHGGVSYTDGVIGQAGSFNSSNSYIEVLNSDSININNTISLFAWVNFSKGGQNNPRIISKDINGFGTGYELFTDPEGIDVQAETRHIGVNIAGDTIQGFGLMNVNTWHYIGSTYDGHVIKLYIDGNLVGETEVLNDNFQKNNGSLWIGNRRYNAYDNFVGKIDDLRIYNRALNESEIKKLYKMGQSTSLEQFIKIDLNGKKLSKDSETWAYVYDTKTDILWENKIDKDNVGLFDSSSPDYTNLDIMHDYDNRYSIDNLSTIIQRMEATSYFGISDWRLPSTQEFKNLITDLNSSSIYFPNFEGLFYTSTVVKNGVNSQTLEKIWLENGVTSVGTPTNKYRALFATDNFVLQESNSSEAVEMIVLFNETHQDGTIAIDPFTKEWTFNQDLTNLSIDILENTYQNTITSNDLIKEGSTLKVNLTPNANSAVNKLVLQLKDSDGNIVKVSGSETFWSLTKTNHAPRLADGQITRLVGDSSAYLDIETYDSDGDTE